MNRTTTTAPTAEADRPPYSSTDHGDEPATGAITESTTGPASSEAESGPKAGGDQSVARAARGTALNMAGSLITAVVSFVTVGLVTNNFGKAGAGLFFSATAIFTLAANGARLGAESSLTFFVSRLRAAEQHHRLIPVIRSALFATGSVAAVLGLIGFVLAPTLSRAMTDGSDSVDTMTLMIRVLALAIPTFALSQALFGATRGFGTMRPAVTSGQIVRPLSQLVLVAAVIAVSDEVWLLAVAWAVASTLTLVPVSTWLIGRMNRIRSKYGARQELAPPIAEQIDEQIDESADEVGRQSYWRFAGPRAAADLLSAALERLDVILVAMLVGEVGAGLYGASNRLILAGQMLMIATAQSMAPHLSARFLKGENDEAETALRTVSGWNVTILWPVFIVLAFGADTALSVFGAEFTDAAPLVIVLSLGFLVVTGLGIGDTLLVMTGDSVASLINHAVALTVMVVASFALLPTVGIVGAAWAWALSRVTLRVLAVSRVWYTKRIHAIGRQVVVAAGVAIAAYVPLGLILLRTVDSGPLALALHVAIGGAMQLGLASLYRQTLELDQLLAVVRRR